MGRVLPLCATPPVLSYPDSGRSRIQRISWVLAAVLDLQLLSATGGKMAAPYPMRAASLVALKGRSAYH